jgi:phosphoribosylformimino-5-aminoimidazole carboxamide ribotide isomerase
MLGGSSLELYKALLASYPLAKLVASGGVSSVQEVRQLRLAGLDGAIIGKAIYEGLIDIGELAKEVL